MFFNGSSKLQTKTDGISVTGEVAATSLDISGDVDVDGTLETDALSINSTTVTSTATELNLLDGGTSASSSITVVDADRFIVNDDGTMKQIAASDLKTYASADATALAIALG